MGRPREFDPDAVLDQCMKVFWSKGYEATSLDDLLRETGLARQSLYNGFGGKHALFLAALRRYDEQSDQMLRESFGGNRLVRDALLTFMLGIVERSEERRRRGCFMVNSAVELSPHDPETARLVAAQHRSMERFLQRELEGAKARGEISVEKSPRALARFLVGFLNGLNVVAKVNPDRAALRDMVNVALQALD
jgi:TetR/AcrR family transcriptional repressor of nem operon